MKIPVFDFFFFFETDKPKKEPIIDQTKTAET